MVEPQVLEGAEDFQIGSGPVGALLVHGFTGSPQGMRALGEHLAAAGISVVAPRIPGHGTTWQDLNSRRHPEWVAAVEEAHARLAEDADKIFLVGLSFGASLCIDFAARHPDKVAGIVLLSPFVHTKDPRRFLAPVVRMVVQSLPGVGNDIADPNMREIAYDRVPTSAAYSMLQFIRRARRSLPAVTAPTLIIHSRQDHTAHPDNALMIHNQIGSRDKELVWLERSYHVITVDLEREEVYDRTLRFIKERSHDAV